MASVVATVALVTAFPGAVIVELAPDDLGGYALALAIAGWDAFPLRGKIPAIAKADGGNGVLDATTDLDQIAAWWTAMPRANIGGRVPAGCAVLDIDPRHGGLESLSLLEQEHGPLPATRTAWSGRGDGGRHFYFRHPGGEISAKRLPDGLDLKTHTGYCVLPPSTHPDTGQPYRWDDLMAPIVTMPDWLIALLCPVRTITITGRTSTYDGDSIADWYTTTHTWGDILGPCGWHVVDGDGEHDGSTWRHPNATAATSATIRHGCLFVYSSNTPFEPTETGDPHGYTRFRASAVLDHGGELSAAARAARTMREVAA
jgi:hypothetical protein